MSDSLRPHGLYSLSGSSVHGIFQARVLEWGAISFSRGSSQPRNLTRVSRIAGRRYTVWEPSEMVIKVTQSQTVRGHCWPETHQWQTDSLPAEPQGKPKNAGMGSLSLLQQTFLTQESNWSLLHCRWILYQLSYWGSSLKEWTNIHLMVKILLSHSNPHIKSFVQCVVVIGGSWHLK